MRSNSPYFSLLLLLGLAYVSNSKLVMIQKMDSNTRTFLTNNSTDDGLDISPEMLEFKPDVNFQCQFISGLSYFNLLPLAKNQYDAVPEKAYSV